MLTAQDALRIYQHLLSQNIPVWIVGGWGIDALLGEQTRPHKDLDILMLLDDVLRLRGLLSRDGFTLKELWEENLDVLDSHGNQTSTAFVLREPGGLEIDIHALRPDGHGNHLPAWNNDEGYIYTPQDLGGAGLIAGVALPCMSAVMQVRCHTGYELPEYQVRDLARLHATFGLEHPPQPVPPTL